jgi:glycosyltransferase involved in cell wall biosynthesis
MPLLGGLRRWDRAAARRPDIYVANSHATAQRIRDTYARESRVIFPPIEVDRVAEPAGPPQVDEPYYLVVSRLLPYKRVDIAMRACQARGARLVIVGAGPTWGSLQELAQPTTQFRPVIPDAELASLFQHCRAVLVCGEEDFGIVPLEANGAGRPVVAYAAGGALETVVDGSTGVLFHEPTVEAVSGALDRIEANVWPSERLVAHAKSFGEARFHREMSDVVDEAVRHHPH